MMLCDLLCFTVIKVNVNNTVFYNPNGQMAGYCIYEMYLFSRISKALFEQVFSSTDTDKDADINTHTRTHTHALSAVKVLSYPERAAAKYDPSLAVNDLQCVYVREYVYTYFTPTISLLSQLTRAHY